MRKKSLTLTIISLLFLVPLTVSQKSLASDLSRTNPSIVSLPELDGTITPNEYNSSAFFAGGEFQLYWSVTDTEFYMGMIGQTSGWVSIGFSPSAFMKDADMIFGWVYLNGTVNITDAYSIDNFGPHPPDINLGGTNDILEGNATEIGGSTSIEIRRLLDTGDIFDNPIPSEGDLEIIWGVGINDDLSPIHTSRGKGTISISQGTSEETTLPGLWIYHAVFMTLGFLSLSAGVIINRLYRKKKWRVKVHKHIGIWGSLISLIGLILSIVMVSNHLSVIHHFFGIIAIPFVVITPIVGYLFATNLRNYWILNKLTTYKKQMRRIHRWLGYITVLLMLASIISGLIRAFG